MDVAYTSTLMLKPKAKVEELDKYYWDIPTLGNYLFYTSTQHKSILLHTHSDLILIVLASFTFLYATSLATDG